MNSTKSVILTRDANREAYSWSTSDCELSILSFFLVDDCYCFGVDKYYKWVIDATSTYTNGNATLLEKTEKGIELSSDFNSAEPPYLYLTPKNFVEMLDAWQVIIAKKPQEVRLSLQNGIARLEIIH